MIGHPLADDPQDVKAGFHAAPFEGGATVVSTPLELSPLIGRRPVLAWTASAMLDEAIATAWPLLQRAEQVTVMHAAERHEGEGATSTATVERLRDAGASCVTDACVPPLMHH